MEKQTMVNRKGTVEKLRVLIEHWISHNEEHARQYREWADRIESEGLLEAATAIRQAADLVIASNTRFLSAQENIRGVN